MPPQSAAISFPRVTFIMDPTPNQVRRDVLLLEEKIKNYTKPLQYSKQIIIGDVRRAFLTETDPVEGTHWPALSDRAARVPREGMLRRVETNARLYRAMVNRFNYGVTRQGVYLNQARVPFYAVYHQQDDRLQSRISREAVVAEAKRLVKVGFRKDVKNQEQRLKEIKQQALENVRSEAEFEKGRRIPRRRFIGPSETAQAQMFRVFDEWAREAIIIYKRGNILVRRAR